MLPQSPPLGPSEDSGSVINKTCVSTPSSSTSGCVSGHDEAESPTDRCSWIGSSASYIPSTIEDGQARFGFIEEALAGASEAQLLAAEDRCKSCVLESAECSEERRWLVRQLVELRLRLQEDSEPGGVVRLVLGHHMEMQESGSTGVKMQCDRCCGAIWAVIHSWYLCRDCGYACHSRCLSQVTRTCVHLIISEKPEFELRICPEVSLAGSQGFRCAECRNHITFTFPKGLSCFGRPFTTEHSWVEPRLCDYLGRYFCPNCHWNSSAVIPARVVHNWDFEPRKVSRAARQLIRLLSSRPVLPLNNLNPRLFDLVVELSSVQAVRDSLLLMKQYLVTCRSAGELRLLRLLRSRQHFLESPHLYSLDDLIAINSGDMLTFLTRVRDAFAKHIQQDCKQCQGRGYLCELCEGNEILFPFEVGVDRCSECSSVFHRTCWAKRGPDPQCPKCTRLSERAAARLSAALEDHDEQD